LGVFDPVVNSAKAVSERIKNKITGIPYFLLARPRKLSFTLFFLV